MSKYTIIIFLGLLVAILPLLGFPNSFRTGFLVFSGLSIAILAYLSSVVYCSNCKKLIDEAERVLEKESPDVILGEPKRIE